MNIVGLQKLTLLDFPGEIACTVFLGGCNFRCPFCHNASLVLGRGEQIDEEDFFLFLKSRVGKLGGVCITGGEPTLYAQLPAFIYKIRELGFAVKLDTNGTNPEMLKSLVNAGLVDYVAMDIKNSRERYAMTAGCDTLDMDKIEESVAFLLSGTVDYEFRTTVVAEYHRLCDVELIGEWIRGAKRYFLQNFKDSGDLIMQGLSACDTKTMAEYAAAARAFVPEVEVRG